MGFEKEFLDCMPETVSIERASTDISLYGAFTYETAVSHRARVSERTRQVTNAEGAQEVSTSTIYVASSSWRGTVNDRITIPSDSRQPRIIAVNHPPDGQGQHHMVYFCG